METGTPLTGSPVTLPGSATGMALFSEEALAFLEGLHRNFEHRRIALLEERKQQQAKIDVGILPGFLPETEHIRNGGWVVAPLPQDLQDRRVEITGPVDRKMIINALNSGARTFMADFEDSNTPTWSNLVQGQLNLQDAVRNTISLETADKRYELVKDPAVLLVRPRGWHMIERHVLIDGEPVSASLFDFGLYFFHNAIPLIARPRVIKRQDSGTMCSIMRKPSSICPKA